MSLKRSASRDPRWGVVRDHADEALYAEAKRLFEAHWSEVA